jgi:Raf kinase inhibitor-like YbhB/YbcL family protein
MHKRQLPRSNTHRGLRLLPWLLAATLALLVACSSSSDDATASVAPGDAPAATETAAASTPAPTIEATATPAAPAGPVAMSITSPAFASGEEIPFRYTCDGANILPPLEFANLPEGTVTLAVVIDDPDAPGGTFDHWVRFNIPLGDGLDEGASSVRDVGLFGTFGLNDFGSAAYGGPCPPDGQHLYFFKLFAIDSQLDLAEGATKAEFLAAADGKTLDVAELTGQYARLPALPAPEGLETTPIVGRIGGPYKFISGQGVQVGLDELPFEPGSVEAHWYQQNGSYVIVYRGLDAASIGPLCPGNSIQTAAGFSNVSNAPNALGGCADTVPAAPAGVGVQACGAHLVYITAIPTGTAGNLYGTIESFAAAGALVGQTSVALANPAITPAIDVAAFCGG